MGAAIADGRSDSYAHSYNVDNRVRGRAVLAVAPTKITATPSRPIAGAIEWEDSSGRPFLLIAGGKTTNVGRVSKLSDGTYTADDDSAPADQHTDIVLFRHDGSNADAATVFLPLGASTTMRRRKIDGTYGAVTDAKADVLGVVASNLWRAKGHLVSQVDPRNSDPGDDTKWITGIPAGLSTYPVNVILDLGGSPVLAKGEGLLAYNAAPSQSRFYNLTPYITPHPDNGKGSFGDGRGRIYYNTVSDGILVFRPGFVSQNRPVRFAKIDRDTPFGRIGQMAADAEYVYASIVPGSVRVSGDALATSLGLKVFKSLNGSFTDYTTVLTDGKHGTVADFSDVDEVGPDYIYVGMKEPFWGFVLDMPKAENMVLGAFTIEYSTGTSSWSSSTTVHDSSIQFSQGGAIVISPGADIADVDATTRWVTGTVNSVADKYWLRLSF